MDKKKEVLTIGSIIIKPKNLFHKLLQFLKVSKTQRLIEIELPMSAGKVAEIAGAISDIKTLYGDPESEDEVSDVPSSYLAYIIGLALGIKGKQAVNVREAISEQWTDNELTEALKRIYSSIDFTPMVQLFMLLGKLPMDENDHKKMLASAIYG